MLTDAGGALPLALFHILFPCSQPCPFSFIARFSAGDLTRNAIHILLRSGLKNKQ